MLILCGLIFLALCFDFINGFHDSANSIATIIATKVLTPLQALAWAAIFNFMAFFVLPLHVANTISSGIIKPDYINNTSIGATLLGAIVFNLLTWGFKLPSSSSHALIGALIGVGMIQGGISSLYLKMIAIIFSFIIISPLVGMLTSYCLIKLLTLFEMKNPASRTFNWLQLFSSALMSLGHGGNDAQKTMGVIAGLLYFNGHLEGAYHIPFWVIISCYGVIALGTFSGGWRIIKTVGFKITALKPLSGACAEFGAAFVLLWSNFFGIPISSTHALTGAVVGVSPYQHNPAKKTNWLLIVKIGFAWLLTFPVAALFSAGAYLVLTEIR
jgi:PiT family inorganic phosphate transporter